LAEKRDSHRILAGKSEEKVAHGRARHRWEDNIEVKLYLSRMALQCMFLVALYEGWG
jgi:hypothetical protein